MKFTNIQKYMIFAATLKPSEFKKLSKIHLDIRNTRIEVREISKYNLIWKTQILMTGIHLGIILYVFKILAILESQ